MKHVVIKPHRPPEVQGFAAGRGTPLTFERRETEYAGWMWCVTDSGEGGWVPEAWVTIAGNVCTLTRDYDAFELSVEVGDTVNVELTESSWAFVSDESGKRGWVPLECLEPSEDRHEYTDSAVATD